MTTRFLILLLAPIVTLSACARTPEPSIDQRSETKASPRAEGVPATTLETPAVTATADLPLVVVHKSPSCGCCGLWVDHLEQAGFQVEVRNEDNLNPIKERVGVPFGKGSCHTAEVAGYFVEGHVPAEDIKRLLSEKPNAKGLVLPGMPLGSPGMEVPDGTVQPYTVEIVDQEGTIAAFAQH